MIFNGIIAKLPIQTGVLELVASDSVSVNTTSTSPTTVKTITLDMDFTEPALLLACTRKAGGAVNNYWYGADRFYELVGTWTINTGVGVTGYKNAKGLFESLNGNYGVYPYQVKKSDGSLMIQTCYNSNNHAAINGIYNIYVYKVKASSNFIPLFGG